MQLPSANEFIRACRVHAVTDQSALEDPEFEPKADRLARAGAAIAFRAHGLTGREFYDRAVILRSITREAGVPFIINTRLDIALAVSADFIQLGHHSLPLEAAAHICRERGLPFGYSCHDLAQAERALAFGAGYLYLGTIFATVSKPGIKTAGLGLVEEICRQVGETPVFAIGGMSPETAPQVAAAGAFGCAAVSALWRSARPEQSVADMTAAFLKNT